MTLPTLSRARTRLANVRVPRITGAVLLALLGVALAAGITYAASTVVSTPIGLSSESTDIGQSLAPRTIPVKPKHSATDTTTTTTVTTTTTTPTLTTTMPPAVTTSPPATTPPAATTPSAHHDDDGDDD